MYFIPGPSRPLTAVTVNTTRGFAVGPLPSVNRMFLGDAPTAQRSYDTARDSKRFLGLTSGDGGDPTQANQIHVVINWFDELRARAPVK